MEALSRCAQSEIRTSMDDSSIESKLKAMIVERLYLKVKPDEIPTDASLTDTYGIDSVSLLELVVGLEETFGIRIEEGDFNLRDFSTVAALRDFVRARLDSGADNAAPSNL